MAKKSKSLKRPSLSRLWGRILISLVAFLGVVDISLQLFMAALNQLLAALPYLEPWQLFDYDATLTLIIFIIVIFLVSPWLLTAILKTLDQSQPLPLYKLTTRCPITAQLILRYCRQQKLPFPRLEILPTQAPIIFSYGQFPKNARIILSEGLLKQLSDQEIATLLAGEIGMLHVLPLFIFTGAIALLQVPYLLYWYISAWGETFYQHLPKNQPHFLLDFLWRDIPPLIHHSSAYLAQFFYLAYCLWKLPLNGLFQAQHSYRDERSVSLTKDPNAKVRALIKVASGITHEIETQKQTPRLLETFNCLFPVGHRQGLHLGSLSSHCSLENILSWENSLTYRHHLNGLNSHPLLSDRAFNLLQLAQPNQLPLELDISPPLPAAQSLRERLQKLISASQVFPLFQSSLYVGISLGIIFRITLWGIGLFSKQLDLMNLAWLAEADSLLMGCILFIFSLSIILGINHYFPNIKVDDTNYNPFLPQCLTTLNHPQQVYPLRIKGQLIGRSGISNWLGQDLMLKTDTGTIFLHFSSRLGIIGNLLPNFPRPNQFVEQPVIVSGWLRRGIIPWIDVENINNDKQESLQAGYPVGLTIIAVVAAILGANLILQA